MGFFSSGTDGQEDMKRIYGTIVAEGRVKPEKGVKVYFSLYVFFFFEVNKNGEKYIKWRNRIGYDAIWLKSGLHALKVQLMVGVW